MRHFQFAKRKKRTGIAIQKQKLHRSPPAVGPTWPFSVISDFLQRPPAPTPRGTSLIDHFSFHSLRDSHAGRSCLHRSQKPQTPQKWPICSVSNSLRSVSRSIVDSKLWPYFITFPSSSYFRSFPFSCPFMSLCAPITGGPSVCTLVGSCMIGIRLEAEVDATNGSVDFGSGIISVIIFRSVWWKRSIWIPVGIIFSDIIRTDWSVSELLSISEPKRPDSKKCFPDWRPVFVRWSDSFGFPFGENIAWCSVSFNWTN